MAVPRFVEVEKDGRDAFINIESIQSIEESSCSDSPFVIITITGGREFVMRIGDKAEHDCGGKIYAALHEIVDTWHSAGVNDDYSFSDSPYYDQVVATLIEGEPIPIVMENPGEFRD